jgi:4'-phosphopantetheinyl transferase
MSIVSDDSSQRAPLRLVWTEAPRRLTLDAGAVHVWRIRTDDLGIEVGAALGHLGGPQRARAARMRNRDHRDRYVRAQAGLRVVLSRYLDCTPAAIGFTHGPAGKPELAADRPAIAFNLTTTGDLALVAVGPGGAPESRIGIDCEWIRPRRGIEGVAARLFAPDVRDALLALPEAERLDAFYRAWTALEADAKSDGRGLLRARAAGEHAPCVAHCIPEVGYIAAVARLSLPPPADWSAFDLGGEA